MATISYKCPGCGGGLIFDPTTQMLKCEYCLSKFYEQQLKDLNCETTDDTEAKKADEQTSSETNKDEQNYDFVQYSCPSCGAEIVTDSTTAATFCYYCHNPVVLEGRLGGEFKPDKMIPFTITKQEATDKFLAWTKKKWFVPKWFFSKKQIDTITGVYFPHWIVDSDTTGAMDTEGRKIRTWRTGNMEYTETKYYRVIREGNIHLEDVTRTALKKANKKIVDGIHPFDEKKIIDFSTAYLTGFQAEKRDIERAELEAEVNAEIINHTATLVARTAGDYIGINSQDVNARILSTDWCYVLFPVWTITYKDKNKEMFYYAINGESGKVCGKLPIDYKKLSLFSAGIAVVSFAVLMLAGYLL